MRTNTKRVKLGNGEISTATTIKQCNNEGNKEIATNGANQNRIIKLCVENEILKTKPTRATDKIIEGHILLTKEDRKSQPAAIINEETNQGRKGNRRVLPRKLLDEGQGKFLSDMEISNSSSNKAPIPAPTPGAKFIGEDAEHVLLCPPIIEAMGQIATGATTNKL